MKRHVVVKASSEPVRKVVKASRTTADMLAAFEDKLEELEVNSATDPEKKIACSDDIVDWLAEHDQAYADAVEYFGTDDLESVSQEELESWIGDHDQLWEDYRNFFGIEGCDAIAASEEVEINGEDYNEKYEDVGGGFGDVGEIYSLADIKRFWNEDKDDDPILAEYSDFESWWRGTRDNFLSEVHDF